MVACGRALTSPLLTIDPVERRAYQHIEYSPLFNPRAHRFGKRREILNRSLAPLTGRNYGSAVLYDNAGRMHRTSATFTILNDNITNFSGGNTLQDSLP